MRAKVLSQDIAAQRLARDLRDAAAGLEELADQAHDGIRRIRRRPRLLFAFLDCTGLSL
jgi:hypothetical protein